MRILVFTPLFVLFGKILGEGSSARADLYLLDGQIVRLKGFDQIQCKTDYTPDLYIFVQIKPGETRQLWLGSDDYEPSLEFKEGYLYRFLRGKFQMVDIGKNITK